MVVSVSVSILFSDGGSCALENVVVDADYVCAVDLSVAVDIITLNMLDCQSLSFQQSSSIVIEIKIQTMLVYFIIRWDHEGLTLLD